MIKIEKTEITGWEAALRGMRNPLNSWERADTKFYPYDTQHPEIGANDMDLMKRLCKAGGCHRKFMRMIFVSMDITAPLYWWKEFDTYKVGTVANSCSTMHKIAAKKFTADDFSHEHLLTDKGEYPTMADLISCNVSPSGILDIIITCLNNYRGMYLETKDKVWWWQMIQMLPSSYNQKRTVTFSYENVIQFIEWRTNHKLDEWNEFVQYLWNLPYIRQLIGEEE